MVAAAGREARTLRHAACARRCKAFRRRDLSLLQSPLRTQQRRSPDGYVQRAGRTAPRLPGEHPAVDSQSSSVLWAMGADEGGGTTLDAPFTGGGTLTVHIFGKVTVRPRTPLPVLY